MRSALDGNGSFGCFPPPFSRSRFRCWGHRYDLPVAKDSPESDRERRRAARGLSGADLGGIRTVVHRPFIAAAGTRSSPVFTTRPSLDFGVLFVPFQRCPDAPAGRDSLRCCTECPLCVTLLIIWLLPPGMIRSMSVRFFRQTRGVLKKLIGFSLTSNPTGCTISTTCTSNAAMIDDELIVRSYQGPVACQKLTGVPATFGRGCTNFRSSKLPNRWNIRCWPRCRSFALSSKMPDDGCGTVKMPVTCAGSRCL